MSVGENKLNFAALVRLQYHQFLCDLLKKTNKTNITVTKLTSNLVSNTKTQSDSLAMSQVLAACPQYLKLKVFPNTKETRRISLKQMVMRLR